MSMLMELCGSHPLGKDWVSETTVLGLFLFIYFKGKYMDI